MLENQKTLRVYEANMEAYIRRTPQNVVDDVKMWIDKTLSYVPNGGTIFEIGSAFGRDADYMEAHGHVVIRSDAVIAFVDLLKSQGHQAQLVNAINDPLGGPYDLIFADAVLLHFTIEQTDLVLEKIFSSLKGNGIFSFRVKQGDGSEWSSAKLGAPRYYQYWQADDLFAVLERHHFSVLYFNEGSSKFNDSKWLEFIVTKATK